MTDRVVTFQTHIRACRRCTEAGHSVVNAPIVAGSPRAGLMIVGQAPGRVEAQDTGLPFSGPAGKRLFRWLASAGWDEVEFRSTQYMTAITKGYPGPNTGSRGDRVPGRAEQELCLPWLEQELALIQPEVIVPVGGLAITRFLGSRVKLAQVIGRLFHRPTHDQTLTPWARAYLPLTTCLIPLPHPSGASLWINRPEHRILLEQALEHLARQRKRIQAARHTGSGRLTDHSDSC